MDKPIMAPILERRYDEGAPQRGKRMVYFGAGSGFVEATVDAQRRLYRLKPQALREVDAWLAQFRQLWSAHGDALERYLDRMDTSPPKKRKKRKR